MFDHNSGIEVRIKPFESLDQYAEYEPPSTSELYAGDRNVRYIEAVTGERFVIEVILHPTFEWMGEPTVRVRYLVDDAIKVRGYLHKPSSTASVRDTLQSFSDHVDGARSVCGMTFSKASAVDDDDFLGGEEEDAEIANRGKIEVKLQRGILVTCKAIASQTMSTQRAGISYMPDKTTTKVAKKNGRSHSTRPVVLQTNMPDKVTSGITRMWTPRGREAGSNIVFTFYYTNSMFLVSKKMKSVDELPVSLTEGSANPTSNAVQQPPVPSSAQKRKAPDSDGVTFVRAKYIGNGEVKNEEDERVGVAVSKQLKMTTPPRNHEGSASGNARRKAEIRARLEEIKLERELRQLEEHE